MNAHTFTVTLTIDGGKLSSDEEIKELAKNIGLALQKEAKEYGLSPEESDAYVKSIHVSPQFLPEGDVTISVM